MVATPRGSPANSKRPEGGELANGKGRSRAGRLLRTAFASEKAGWRVGGCSRFQGQRSIPGSAFHRPAGSVRNYARPSRVLRSPDSLSRAPKSSALRGGKNVPSGSGGSSLPPFQRFPRALCHSAPKARELPAARSEQHLMRPGFARGSWKPGKLPKRGAGSARADKGDLLSCFVLQEVQASLPWEGTRLSERGCEFRDGDAAAAARRGHLPEGAAGETEQFRAGGAGEMGLCQLQYPLSGNRGQLF